jgi:hypothetical protein
LVLKSGVKDNVKFKVTPVIPVAPCLPVFQWSPHQQHLQIDGMAAGKEWSEMWPQKDVWLLQVTQTDFSCSIELRKFGGIPSALLLL